MRLMAPDLTLLAGHDLPRVPEARHPVDGPGFQVRPIGAPSRY